jgi:hypothetical protein
LQYSIQNGPHLTVMEQIEGWLIAKTTIITAAHAVETCLTAGDVDRKNL